MGYDDECKTVIKIHRQWNREVYLQGFEIAYWELNHNHSLSQDFVNN